VVFLGTSIVLLLSTNIGEFTLSFSSISPIIF
jgi:hypothetical protein